MEDFLATCGTLRIIHNVRGISEDEDLEKNTNTTKLATEDAEKAVELSTPSLESMRNVGHGGFTTLDSLKRLIATKKIRCPK